MVSESWKGPLMLLLACVAPSAASGCQPPVVVVPPSLSVSPPPAVPPPQPAHRDWDLWGGPDSQLPTRSASPFKRPVAPRPWKYIVLHHTATARGDVDSIDRAHRRRTDSDGKPWLGIGYHFVIGNGNGMGDGEVQPTFRWRQQLHGAHAGVEEYNELGIGIVLVGNFDEGPPTAAQLAATKKLVAALKAAYKIGADRVLGHGEINQTACPGKFFPLAEVSRSLPETRFGRRDASRDSFGTADRAPAVAFPNALNQGL